MRSILGRKTGHQSKAYQGFAERKFNIPKNIVKPINQNHEILEGKEKKEFLEGAEIAYETILTSFANGELKKLKSLLTSSMNSNFTGAITARNNDKIKSEFTFIGMKESSVEEYEKLIDVPVPKKSLFETQEMLRKTASDMIERNKDILGEDRYEDTSEIIDALLGIKKDTIH